MISPQVVYAEQVAPYAQQLLALAATSPNNLIHREYHLPFLRVTARFADASFARLCDEGLVNYEPSPVVGASSPLDLAIMSPTCDAWPLPAKWSESSFSPVAFDRIITGHQLRGYYHHEQRFWQFYDPVARRGVQAMQAADRFPPWESCGPLRSFLHWAYDWLGMRLAHAATLGMDGRGVLLAGRGGSGKSATTLAGLCRGLQTAGDDYVLLEGDNACRAHAIFARMKQDASGLQRANLSAHPIANGPLNWQNKFEFDPRVIHNSALCNKLEIIAILLPQIAHGERTQLRPASPAEAMLALAPSGLFQMPGCAASGVRFFARLVRRLSAFHLILGRDATEIADTLADFLTAHKELVCAG